MTTKLQEQPTDEATSFRSGEYASNGEFHRNLNPNWSYYPIYLNKLEVIDGFLRAHSKPSGAILDAGCGEGVLVEKYNAQGRNIIGVDKNYASAPNSPFQVVQGSLLELPFTPQQFDTVLCLDVLEHLLYPDQTQALCELRRVIKPDGTLIVSIPNLAHFTSRLKLLFRGKLLRTASIYHHPGDRPAREYQELLEANGFEVIESQGIFPTVPPIYRWVMRHPAKTVGLLRFLRKLPIPLAWHFQVLFVCRPKV